MMGWPTVRARKGHMERVFDALGQVSLRAKIGDHEHAHRVPTCTLRRHRVPVGRAGRTGYRRRPPTPHARSFL